MVPLLERTNGSVVGLDQWFPCWNGPMVPLLEWTNGSFVGVDQWFPCWSGPMAPLLEWSNGSLVGVDQWFPCWSEPMVPLLEWTNGSLVGVHQWFLCGFCGKRGTPRAHLVIPETQQDFPNRDQVCSRRAASLKTPSYDGYTIDTVILYISK